MYLIEIHLPDVALWTSSANVTDYDSELYFFLNIKCICIIN